MAGKPTIDRKECPDGKAVEDQARRAFEALLTYCRTEDGKFHRFEQRLFTRLFALGRLLVLVYLTHRNLRLPVRYNERNYRRGEPYATRTLQTVFGEVTYGRLYLRRRKGGSGYHPLDVALGLTRDGFSPTAISLLARLTTRMSYQSVQVICRAAWGWARPPRHCTRSSWGWDVMPTTTSMRDNGGGRSKARGRTARYWSSRRTASAHRRQRRRSWPNGGVPERVVLAAVSGIEASTSGNSGARAPSQKRRQEQERQGGHADRDVHVASGR